MYVHSRTSGRISVMEFWSPVVPWYDQIRLTRRAHCLTGHKTGSSVRPWMIVSCFILFFCISNVTATLSANSKSSDGVESRRPSLNNLILQRQSSFVRFISLRGTFRYYSPNIERYHVSLDPAAKDISYYYIHLFAIISADRDCTHKKVL